MTNKCPLCSQQIDSWQHRDNCTHEQHEQARHARHQQSVTTITKNIRTSRNGNTKMYVDLKGATVQEQNKHPKMFFRLQQAEPKRTLPKLFRPRKKETTIKSKREREEKREKEKRKNKKE